MIGIDAAELEQLSIYNAERRRGLLHSDMWIRDMERLQERYDRQIAELAALAQRGRRNGRRKTQPQRLLEEIIA